MINEEQRKECEQLYKSGAHKIKEIMEITGIKSEQTIYRILDQAGIPRRPKRGTDWTATISFDKVTSDIIDEIRPKNLSKFVCECIQKVYKEL